MDTPIQPRRSIPTELKPRLRWCQTSNEKWDVYFLSTVEMERVGSFFSIQLLNSFDRVKFLVIGVSCAMKRTY